MNYFRADPTSQDEALAIVKTLFCTIVGYFLTLLNSGTGSGKSRMMREMSDYWHITYGDKAVTYLIAPSAMIGQQLLDGEFAATHTIINVKPSAMIGQQLLDGEFAATHAIINVKDFKTATALYNAVLDAIEAGLKVLICTASAGHSGKSFKPETDRLITLMGRLRDDGMRQLVLIDEMHVVLTSLTGGMNARVNHAREDMKHYDKILEQRSIRASLNLFDKFKLYGAHVVACSATLNNVICSKLATTGIAPREIQVWNLFPIRALYDRLRCEAVDVRDFAAIAPHLAAAEAGDGKILLIFPAIDDKGKGRASIEKFRTDYERHMGRPMPATVEITGRTNLEEIDDQLRGAKYVMGVNLLGTGFDIGTHAKGTSFSLGILFRQFSDKASQPLSANPRHRLHVQMSAALAQVLGRMRAGGLFLVPTEYDGVNLYDLQLSVSEAIHRGHTQHAEYYVAESLQVRRYHHAILVALVHNIRWPDLDGDERPTVDTIIADLRMITGRDFKAELGAPVFCTRFWVDAIGSLWQDFYYAQHQISTGDREADRVAIEARLLGADGHRRHSRRGTTGDGREEDPRVRALVKERAGGRCCHCGRSDMAEEEWQLCHFQRYAAGGPLFLDNLGWGHRACDASFDGRFLIHLPYTMGGGYWLHPNCASYRPDAWQLGGISPYYIEHRWAEHKAALCPEADLRVWLSANGWVHHA